MKRFLVVYAENSEDEIPSMGHDVADTIEELSDLIMAHSDSTWRATHSNSTWRAFDLEINGNSAMNLHLVEEEIVVKTKAWRVISYKTGEIVESN